MKDKASVVALAGRRVDAADTDTIRFPETNIEHVKALIRDAFRSPLRTLVCSAAAGADLLALSIAGEMGIRRRVIIPFDSGTFRQFSVADRPGNWVEDFDRSVAEIVHAGDLVVLGLDSADPAAYSKTNIEILNEAARLAEKENSSVCAVVVWDGEPRGPEDFTAHFRNEALARDLTIREISTLH
jgi:hypothetical protein